MNYLYAVIIETSEVMSTIANGSSKPSKEQTCAHMQVVLRLGTPARGKVNRVRVELSQLSELS